MSERCEFPGDVAQVDALAATMGLAPVGQQRHPERPRGGYPDTRAPGNTERPRGGYPDTRAPGNTERPRGGYPDTRAPGNTERPVRDRCIGRCGHAGLPPPRRRRPRLPVEADPLTLLAATLSLATLGL